MKQRYIPSGSTEIKDNQSTAIVYTRESNGTPFAIAYHGKATNQDWHYKFKNEADRSARIQNHFIKIRTAEQERIRRRVALRNEPRDLEIGDVLRCAWGYEQTNNNFYQVTALSGNKSVILREISKDYDETGFMAGKAKPIKDQFIGKPFTKVSRSGCIKISSFMYARKCDENKTYYESHYA